MLEERVEPNVSSEGFFHLANQIDRLDAKIDRQNERLVATITEQGKQLDTKIDRQNERLVAAIIEQGRQFDSKINHLDAKIDQIVAGNRWIIGLIITAAIAVAMIYLR